MSKKTYLMQTRNNPTNNIFSDVKSQKI